MLSKLSKKFTKEFIDKSGLLNVQLLNVQSRNTVTEPEHPYLINEEREVCQKIGNDLYIPLCQDNQLYAYLKVPLSENSSFTVNKAEKLKDTLEHSLAYVELNRGFLHLDLENEFLIDLILRDKMKNQEQITERARIVHYDLEIERHLVFIDIRDFKKRTRERQNQNQIQEALKNLYQLLQKNIETYNEYAIHLYDDKFVLLKENRQDLHSFLNELRERTLRELHLNLLFIVSEPCVTTEDYYIAFKKMHTFHQAYIRKETTQSIFDIKNYEVELLLLGISPEAKELFLYSKVDILKSVSQRHLDFIKTFKVFFKCNLNTKAAASELYLHSNTIYYRIKKLSELLDMDLFKPNDALSLYISLQFMKS